MTAAPSSFKPRRWLASAISGVIAGSMPLLSVVGYQLPAMAQNGVGQICYAIADNNPPGDGDGGVSFPDTLVRIDFGQGSAEALETVRRPDGTTINDIEALTSRPEFNELIATNANEVGRVDPDTGIFTSLGFLTPYFDFDAITIDRRSANQTRLLGVSKRGGSLNNVLVEAFVTIDPETGQSTGLSAVTRLAQIPLSEFPPDTNSIDGMALSPVGSPFPENVVYGVANRGPNTPRETSAQVLVTIDPTTGELEEKGNFISGGEQIDDVEDISFDLFGNLFVSSGSNFSRFADNAFIIPLDADGNAQPASRTLSLAASGGQDFEASACLPFTSAGSLVVVKRITAIARNGVNTPITGFFDQPNDSFDNLLFDETNGALPVGLVEEQTALSPGDEVEYTIYVYNPTFLTLRNAVLCDPLRRPNILQAESIEYSEPGAVPENDAALAFESDASGFARSPMSPADAACLPLLDGDQFISGPVVGGERTGGGVVSESFSLAPNNVAAIRFRVTIGQFDEEAVEQGNGDT
ncbi:MAG: hypothetical protein AAF716_04735 [Cyanobacteria bacterium P01_D01_bin.1]